MSQEKFLKFYMRVAEEASRMSYATRLKVGAVAVKDHRILSVGYNGTPPNFDNQCEVDGKTRPEVIHAEQNCIYKMARDGQPALGATLFVTHSPCMECAKAIATSGFQSVYYRHHYRSPEGVEFLSKLGIDIQQLGG